ERHPKLKDEASALYAAWPPLVSGAHRLEFGDVVLTLFFADIAIMRELRLAADAIYLDGFAPAKNPDMWTHQVMRSLSRLAAAQEASGNHAGAFHPIATPDDSVFARLTRAAFLYALRSWQELTGLRHDRCGLLQLARSERETASQQAALAGLPPEYAQLVTRAE